LRVEGGGGQVEVGEPHLARERPADVVLARGAQLDERFTDAQPGRALVLERFGDLLGGDDAGFEQDVGDAGDARTDQSHAGNLPNDGGCLWDLWMDSPELVSRTRSRVTSWRPSCRPAALLLLDVSS